jgi:DHA1 family tetracycline resistance protein-like MFS transporter
LLGDVHLRLPFWAAAGFSLLNAAYGFFVLPESLPVNRRARLDLSQANPLGALGLLRSRPRVLGLALVSFFGNLAHGALPSVFVLYANYRYGWGERAVGLTLALVGVCSMIVQAGLVGPIVARLGERRALLFGQCMGAIGFTVYGSATSGSLFLLGVPLMAFWGVAGAAVQGLLTARVAPDEQGRLQGATSSLSGIAELIGPLLFTSVFAAFIDSARTTPMPGAPLLLAGLLLGLGALLAWSVTARPLNVSPSDAA